MLNGIAFIIFIASFTIIIVIIRRKIPILKEFKIEEAEEREKRKKRFLLEERLKRKLRIVTSKVAQSGFSIQLAARLPGELQRFYKYLQNKKGEYWKVWKKRRQKDQNSSSNDQNTAQLAAAEDLMKQEKFDDAEKTALLVIKENPKSLRAYKLLAEIYLKSKNFLHAEATFEHVVKLAHRLKNTSPAYYLELAQTKLKLEKVEDALQNAKKAVTLEPSNPKMLHFITKVCILAKQKELGWKYYLKLKKINPENEGLDELLEELKRIG